MFSCDYCGALFWAEQVAGTGEEDEYGYIPIDWTWYARQATDKAITRCPGCDADLYDAYTTRVYLGSKLCVCCESINAQCYCVVCALFFCLDCFRRTHVWQLDENFVELLNAS